MRNLPLITSAMLVVTHRCNLKCRYCFVSQCNSDMSYETALKAANFLIANAERCGDKPNITFFGGEPMLRWDDLVVPLVKYIREEYGKPFTVSITSNCTLLTEEKIDFMKKYQVGLLFSIDGDKETQDYNRPTHGGTGSFNLVEPKVDMVIQHFPNTVFRSTIIPETCHLTWHNMEFAIKAGYRTIFTTPNVFEPWSDDKREILKEQIQKYTDYYIESYRNNEKPVLFTLMEEAMRRVLPINHSIQNGQYRTHYLCAACSKCGLSADRYCSVAPDGGIYSCQELTSNEGPNSIFYIGSLNDGVDEARRNALIDMYDPFKASAVNTDCATCKYNRACDGGCVANNYMINGDIHKNAEMYCWWRRLLLSEAERILQTLGTEENELFREYWREINRGR